MKDRARTLMFIFFIFFSVLFVSAVAQEQESQEVPSGMEVMKVGPTQLVVPKGMRIRKKRGLIVLEDVNEYVARELSAIQERLQVLEEKNEELKEELGRLQDALEQMRKESVLLKGEQE
ncbi:MAG: hypothetical protein JSW40_01360 [Candidatus Omnitrophota bacterium]|nr:MAG: hypothetical protein JSW40_01360 [Candidatus Omnitrophota bacterium]